jgi:hypothetical protein
LLLALDARAVPEALGCFEQARTIARRQQARALELRACLSIARAARDHGGSAPAKSDANAELAAICAGFAAGSNSAELVAARELLRSFE